MTIKINTIKLGIVNAYLIQANKDFYLIDTGYSNSRENIEKALYEAGCTKGNLRLIILTHGDGDHIGNAAYLRDVFGSKIAMGEADALMAETGDESKSRKPKPDHLSLLFTVFKRFSVKKTDDHVDRFKPDLFLKDNESLKPFGLEATILSLPGHTNGSIGILTEEGDLFCGDLMYNLPGFGYIDDAITHHQSINRIKELKPRLIYPGHGKAFEYKLLYVKTGKKFD